MSKYIFATAIYHDGRGNYQTNYSGLSKTVLSDFQENMEERNAVWAHLIQETDGKMLATFTKDNSANLTIHCEELK